MALVFILLMEAIGRSMKNKMSGNSSLSSTDNKVSQFQYFQDNLKRVKALTFFNWDILLDAILARRIEENTEASIINSEAERLYIDSLCCCKHSQQNTNVNAELKLSFASLAIQCKHSIAS